MRIYLPATSTTVRELLANGAVGPAPLTGFAVTAGLREWYLDNDSEELEYVALVHASRASLRLIDADPLAARRRVVLAVDVADTSVTVRDDLDLGVVEVATAVPLGAVASMHADDIDAEDTVSLAAESIFAADLDDAAAQERVDDAEGFELAWYANQEIGAYLSSL